MHVTQRTPDTLVVGEDAGRGRPSYYIHYVTAEGERIEWSDFYGSSGAATDM